MELDLTITDLVRDLARVGSQSQEAWKHARESNDFAAFAPWLEKIMALTRRKAECYQAGEKLAPGAELYDALLDEHEPGATAREIADVFAVNKFDLPGGERIVQELKSALELSPPRPGGWRPPIHPTVAASGEGVEALFESLEAHHRHLVEHGLLEGHRLERARFEVESVIQEWGRQRTQGAGALVARVARGELTPEEAALALLGPGPEAEEGAL